MTTKTEKDENKPHAINEVHTYPDGTQVVGTPPFPKESPRERMGAVADEQPTPMHIPAGVPTSGEPAPILNENSREVFEAKVQQQVASDDMSGKDPRTPNPTTSSDKPALANVVVASDLEKGLTPEPTAEDLARIAANIKVEGDYTDEQVEAAALQVARETPGAIPVDTKAKSKAKGK